MHCPQVFEQPTTVADALRQSLDRGHIQRRYRSDKRRPRYRRMRHQSRSHFDVFSLQNNAAGSELVWPQQQSRISPPFIRNADVDVEAIKRKELPASFRQADADPRYRLPW